MKKVLLGNTSIEISPVGLGCMGFTHAYGDPMPENEAAEMIRKAYDFGYTFLTRPSATLAHGRTAPLHTMKP